MLRSGSRHLLRTAAAAAYTTATAAAASPAQPRVALVQGASRGLGLEFVRQLISRPGQIVIAACRKPDEADQLRDLRLRLPSEKQLHIIQLDCTKEGSIERAASHVEQLVPCIDLLINTAGVLHVERKLSPAQSFFDFVETALSRVTLSNLQLSFAVNAFGPILVSKAFAPLLIAAGEQTGASAERPAVIANLSARVGSIGDNRLGGWYSYRASKSALNQLTKTMSLEFERKRQAVACVLLHPGTVDTDLSAPFQKNVPPERLFDKERAVRQLLEIIDRTTMAETGKFFAWDGQEIVW